MEGGRMKTKISFVSASAGSGKTYRITEIIDEKLTGGACRSGGLIATTYTSKAAQELRERVRRRLYDAGQATLAERMDEGLIGTVHSVCGRLLERFAFEAGISSHLEILDEKEAAILLSKAVEAVIDFDILTQIQRLADRLGQKNSRTREYSWKNQVREILNAARANDFSSKPLGGMARKSVDELLDCLPPATTDRLDDQLERAIESAYRQIQSNGDKTQATQKYLTGLRDSLRDLGAGTLSWSNWVRLSKDEPGANSRDAAAPVKAVAARFESHPRLREDIRDYTLLVFSAAERSLSEFQRLKEERGLLDFADLEQRALHLLRSNQTVLETLRQEIDLLVVDEFQDTSPIQLALFMQLATCARETVWVGDVKQAIYGFRNSDPALIQAVIAEVRKVGKIADPLGNSYRSTPELVSLSNALFIPAFEKSLRITAAEVQLESKRNSITPKQPAVVFLEPSSGLFNKGNGLPKKLTRDQSASTIAEGVTKLLSPEEAIRVEDITSKQLRPLEPRDLAVLCRTNVAAAAMADVLTQRGLSVTLSQGGLLQTPEARLAMACLRRLADPSDTLASAEIVALGSGLKTEEWLEKRLEYLEQKRAYHPGNSGDRWGLEAPFIDPAISALERARPQLNLLSLSETLDLALTSGDVFATVSAWGTNATRSAQRRANVESLRALADQYEDSCVKSHSPASVAGFLFWCDDLTAAGEDLSAADEQANTIHVSTYHKAKGLEWPVVVCTDFDAEPKPRVWEISLILDDPSKPFVLADPLANRRLRFWPWPFGQQEKGIPMADRVDASPNGQAAKQTSEEEELRLLYVGLTRPRDLLVLALEKGKATPWFDYLQAPWLSMELPPIHLPRGEKVPAKILSLTPPEKVCLPEGDPDYFWFPPPVELSPKLQARLIPSAQAASPDARIGKVIDFGSRLPVTGKPKEADLGDALHAILAAEFINPGHPRQREAVDRILRAFGLQAMIQVDDALLMVNQFRSKLDGLFHPKSVLVEPPFEITNDSGQRARGFIDLMIETGKGWIIIDHKSFLGGRSAWEDKALSYSGQLSMYRRALANLGKPFVGAWVHFAASGGMVEILLTDAHDT
jgi:ATP-dependent helicase/nuclease subunit A